MFSSSFHQFTSQVERGNNAKLILGVLNSAFYASVNQNQ